MADDLDARLAAVDSATDADTLVDLGCDLAKAARHADAVACFRRAVALGEAWVDFNVANELGEMNQLTEAVEAYRRAIAAGETDAWLNLGLCLEDLGDLSGAKHAYRQAHAAGDPNAAMALAYLLRDQGEQAEAESIARQAARLGNLEAVGAAACWEYERTLDPALEADLRRGAAYYPSARADLAKILRQTGRSEEALRELTIGAKLGEEVCYLPLGNLLRDVFGDTVAAEEAYRAGIAAGDSYCHHNLAILLLEERGDVEAAAEHFRQGVAAGDSMAESALRNLSVSPDS